MPVEEIQQDEPCSPGKEEPLQSRFSTDTLSLSPVDIPRITTFEPCARSHSFAERVHSQDKTFQIHPHRTTQGRELYFSPSTGGLRDLIPELTTSLSHGLLPGGQKPK